MADTIYIEMKFDGINWTDVSGDVIAPITINGGIMDNSPLSRVAGTGKFTLNLNNSISNSAGLAGYYSPGHANCRSGFAAGLQVRLRITYDNATYIKFKGKIPPQGIRALPGNKGERITTVRVHDWMEQAASHKMDLPTYATTKKANEVINLILAPMPIAPETTSLAVGQETFAHNLDTVKSETTALAEFQKLALSEFGYIYLKHSKTSGEILTFDARTTRGLITDLQQIPVHSDECGFLLLEDGGYLLLEDGGKLILDEAQDSSFSNEMDGLVTSHGKNLYNHITARTYPRDIDSAATTVLFDLKYALSIAAGETKTIRGKFRDPNSKATQVAGIDMVTPVATTDYTANTASDGTGTPMTASLSVTATYGVSEVDFSLQNTHGSTTLYVTKLQCRGKGIYIYDTVTSEAKDTTSKNAYGDYPLTLNLKYQDNPLVGEDFSAAQLLVYKDPHDTAETVSFNANRSKKNMFAYLTIEPGMRVYIEETQTGTISDFIVNGTSAEILTNGIINYSWYLTPFSSGFNFWYLGTAGQSELGETTWLGW
jgi:hypothetical protein